MQAEVARRVLRACAVTCVRRDRRELANAGHRHRKGTNTARCPKPNRSAGSEGEAVCVLALRPTARISRLACLGSFFFF